LRIFLRIAGNLRNILPRILFEQLSMSLTLTPAPEIASRSVRQTRHAAAISLLIGLWLVVFFASLFSPPILDDADGTHANAARQMALSGDLVTLRVNNVRYLEKAPLPYWIAAATFRIFGFNTFAAHLPQAIAVLLLMLLGYCWANEAYGQRAALYAGFAVLTSIGVFLFTRIFIPDVLLSLLLATALYCFLKSLDQRNAGVILTRANTLAAPQSAGFYAYALWISLALAVLTKGLVAPVFIFGAGFIYLVLTGEYRNWRALKPGTGILLFLLIATPWHILAGIRNTGGMNGHGFFWFYFINEHVLRFLGKRYPKDYNKLPAYLYWTLHMVWLFPWSLFTPVGVVTASKEWQHRRRALRGVDGMRTRESRVSAELRYRPAESRSTFGETLRYGLNDFSGRSTLLMFIFAGFVLLFFSLSTNQEYYTFPAYLPLLVLISAGVARVELLFDGHDEARASRRWMTVAHATLTTLGLLVATALGYGLWVSRHLAALPDVGDLLAHRGVGDYTLSMSSLFDLTGPSFAALRLPAALALIAFAFGPLLAWVLRSRRRHLGATSAIAGTAALFLVAAHLAFARFAPMLSSQNFAAKIQQLEASGRISPNNTFLLYGDQAYGSSIPFYLNRPLDRPALLVDGRSSSMLFGGTFADSQYLFLPAAQLAAEWGTGERKILFVPLEHRDDVDRLLGKNQILLAESAGKAIITDRPLDK
jgi:4-amino-4-deoxy-L-arabinose transferase-like glycosyltransferase